MESVLHAKTDEFLLPLLTFPVCLWGTLLAIFSFGKNSQLADLFGRKTKSSLNIKDELILTYKD